MNLGTARQLGIFASRIKPQAVSARFRNAPPKRPPFFLPSMAGLGIPVKLLHEALQMDVLDAQRLGYKLYAASQYYT